MLGGSDGLEHTKIKVPKQIVIVILWNVIFLNQVSFLQVNVTGLVIAGSADFKSELSQSDMFDGVSESQVF